VGAGEDYAVLVDPTANEARVFFVNGTAEDVRFNNADLLSPEGTPVCVFSFFIFSWFAFWGGGGGREKERGLVVFWFLIFWFDGERDEMR